MTDLFHSVCHWTRANLGTIGVAWAATMMSIFAGDVTRAVRKFLKGAHFPLRLAVYVLIAAFGAGAITVLAGSLLARFASRLEDPWLFPALVLLFVATGFLAERKNQI